MILDDHGWHLSIVGGSDASAKFAGWKIAADQRGSALHRSTRRSEISQLSARKNAAKTAGGLPCRRNALTPQPSPWHVEVLRRESRNLTPEFIVAWSH